MNIGQAAPNFTAPNRAGENVSLQDFNGRWSVLYFYPKDNTPGCTTQAIDFTSKLAEFHSINTQIIGISPDSIASHEKFISKHNLKIILLSDPEHQIADLYQVWQLKKFMGKEYMGIVRSTFLIDPTGNISHIWSNVKVKNHAEIVLSQLKQIQTPS
jgi:thioredoxin-dependent peroxiredoxin